MVTINMTWRGVGRTHEVYPAKNGLHKYVRAQFFRHPGFYRFLRGLVQVLLPVFIFGRTHTQLISNLGLRLGFCFEIAHDQWHLLCILVPTYPGIIQPKTAYVCQRHFQIIWPSFTNKAITPVSLDIFWRHLSITTRKLVVFVRTSWVLFNVFGWMCTPWEEYTCRGG